MPKFSIIVPVYNVEKYLSTCVNSILSQSYEDFELILVDDGSPDSCPKMCDDFAKADSRIKVIHQKNSGLSGARNAGLKQACGEYIWFVDSDDYVNTNALELILTYTDYKWDIINFGCSVFDEDGEADFSVCNLFFEKFNGLADKKQVCDLMKKACSGQLLTYVWRNIYCADFLKKHSLYFMENLSFAEDGAFNMQSFLLADGILFLKESLYAYRGRQNSISKQREKEFKLDVLNHFTLYDKLRDENYEKYCQYKSEEYYRDAGIFIVQSTYVYALLQRLYKSRQKNSFSLFKKISSSSLVAKAFSRFDIDELKSKSLDWYMFKFVSKRMYFPAYFIYRFFLF